MKLLIDMNLSPKWVEELKQGGWDAVHWSVVGDPQATDNAIMEWREQMGMWYSHTILILERC